MKSQKGQSLVETALILPLLLLLIFGIVDFGRVIHIYLTLDNIGREVARTASIQDIEVTEIEGIVDNVIHAFEPLEEDRLTATAGLVDTQPEGDDIFVELTYSVELLTPMISQITGDLTLEDKTVMRVEGD